MPVRKKAAKKVMVSWSKCSKAEKIARWENAYRVLENLSPHEREKHWNMGFWGKKTDCGTIACAAGHCGLDPWFRKRGLKLSFKIIDKGPNGEPFYAANWNGDSPVGSFFGERGSERIFYNPRYRSVEAVMHEVRQFIDFLKATPARDLNRLTMNSDAFYEILSA